MTENATPTRPARPARTCGWTIPPYDLPTGGRVGYFRVSEGAKQDFYRASLLDGDDMEQAWEVSKEQHDGTFAEPYTVSLPVPGASGDCHCTCPGHAYWKPGRRTCRHIGALRALLARLLGSES